MTIHFHGIRPRSRTGIEYHVSSCIFAALMNAAYSSQKWPISHSWHGFFFKFTPATENYYFACRQIETNYREPSLHPTPPCSRNSFLPRNAALRNCACNRVSGESIPAHGRAFVFLTAVGGGLAIGVKVLIPVVMFFGEGWAFILDTVNNNTMPSVKIHNGQLLNPRRL